MFKFYFSSLVLLSFLHLIITQSPIVEVSDGKILGRISQTPKGKPFLLFQGIPFAAPPLGDLRFADPQVPNKWTDVRNCTHSDVVCLQIRKHYSGLENEDCLILNVYTPKISSNKSDSDLAVLVYFYGGGFYIGNSTYDAYGPEYFIDHDVVIVTVNYRLGPFGFLSTEDAVIPGNFGLKDQQLSLKWVRNNIAFFGGNPEKVTIFGNSAGAASVGYHMLNKNSAGLFRAAIMSSGSPLNTWSLQRHPKKIAYVTAQLVNGSTILKTSSALLQFLRSIPALDLRRASLDLLNLDIYEIDQILNGYYYGPSIDSYMNDGFLKEHSYESVESGHFSHVPVMIGITSEEGLSISEDKEILRKVMKNFDENQALLVPENVKASDLNINKLIGDLLIKIYVGVNESLGKKLGSGIRFLSDQSINNGVLKFAQLASNFSDVFLYQFTYDGLMGHFGEYVEGADTVTHTEDMHYIWRRNLPSVNNLNLETFPQNDRLTQARLLKFYTNFAKYLTPVPKIVKDELLKDLVWPTINSRGSTESVYLDINTNLTVKSNPKYDTYLKWNDLFLKYAVKPYNTF